MLLQPVRKAVLDLTVELIATSSAFIGNCLQVWALRGPSQQAAQHSCPAGRSAVAVPAAGPATHVHQCVLHAGHQ